MIKYTYFRTTSYNITNIEIYFFLYLLKFSSFIN